MMLMARKAIASTPQDATIAELSNPQVVTLAVYLAAGATKNVDTEHIAVQAHRLALLGASAIPPAPPARATGRR